MTITIQTPLTLTDRQEGRIRADLQKLEKYNAGITQVNVYFKEGDGSKPDAVLAQMRVLIPGPDIFVQKSASPAMKAFSEAYGAVRDQLRKYTEKRNDHQSEVKEINDLVQDNF